MGLFLASPVRCSLFLVLIFKGVVEFLMVFEMGLFCIISLEERGLRLEV